MRKIKSYRSPWYAGGGAAGPPGPPGGIGTIIDLTVNAAQSLQFASTLVKGQFYRIIDAMASTWAVIVMADDIDKMGTIGQGIFGGIAGTFFADVNYELGMTVGTVDQITRVYDALYDNYVEGYAAVVLFRWNDLTWGGNHIEDGSFIDFTGSTVASVYNNRLSGQSYILGNASTVATDVSYNVLTGQAYIDISDGQVANVLHNELTNTSYIEIYFLLPLVSVTYNVVKNNSNIFTNSSTVIADGALLITQNNIDQNSNLNLSGANIVGDGFTGGEVSNNIVSEGSNFILSLTATTVVKYNTLLSKSYVNFNTAILIGENGIQYNYFNVGEVQLQNSVINEFMGNNFLFGGITCGGISATVQLAMSFNTVFNLQVLFNGKIQDFSRNYFENSIVNITNQVTEFVSLTDNYVFGSNFIIGNIAIGGNVSNNIVINGFEGLGNTGLYIGKNVTGGVINNEITGHSLFYVPQVNGDVKNNKLSGASIVSFNTLAVCGPIIGNILSGSSRIDNNATTNVGGLSYNSIVENSILDISGCVTGTAITYNTISAGSTLSLATATIGGGVNYNKIEQGSSFSIVVNSTVTNNINNNILSASSQIYLSNAAISDSILRNNLVTSSIYGENVVLVLLNNNQIEGDANLIITGINSTIIDANIIFHDCTFDLTNATLPSGVAENRMTTGSQVSLANSTIAYFKQNLIENSDLTFTNCSTEHIRDNYFIDSNILADGLSSGDRIDENRIESSDQNWENAILNGIYNNYIVQESILYLNGCTFTSPIHHNLLEQFSSINNSHIVLDVQGSMSYNRISENSNINFDVNNFANDFAYNNIAGGSNIQLNDNSNLLACNIKTMNATINTGTNHQNRTYLYNAYSNFTEELDLSDAGIFTGTTLTIPSLFAGYIGIMTFTAIPAACSINTVVNDGFGTPYVFYGDSSNTVTWGFTPLPLGYTQITASNNSYATFDHLTNLILAWLNY